MTTPSIVQDVPFGNATGGALVIACSATGAHNGLLLDLCWKANTTTIVSAAGNVSGALSIVLAKANDTNSDGTSSQSLQLNNISGGDTSITVTFSTAATFWYGRLREITGQDQTTMLDVTPPAYNNQGGLGGTTDSVTSASSTPVTNGCLLIGQTFCIFGATGFSITHGTGWTSGAANPTSTAVEFSETLIQATAAAKAATFTGKAGGNNDYVTTIYAIRPASTAVAQSFDDDFGSMPDMMSGYDVDDIFVMEAALIDSDPVDPSATVYQYDWDEDPTDFYEDPFVSTESWSGPVQPNAPSLTIFDDFPWTGDDDIDDDFFDDFGNVDFDPMLYDDPWDFGVDDIAEEQWWIDEIPQAQVSATASQPPEDVWPWDEDILDEFITDDSEPIDSQSPQADDAWNWFGDDAEDFAQTDETPQAQNALTITVEDAWSWDDDAGDEQLDTAAILGANFVSPGSQVYDDPWDFSVDDAGDEFWTDDSEPIDSSAALVEDPWNWDEDLGEHSVEADVVLGADAPAIASIYDDAWEWTEEVTDETPDADALIFFVSPPIVEDGWDWSADESGEDFSDLDAVLAADVLSPFPVPYDDWDWNEPGAEEDIDLDSVLAEDIQPPAPIPSWAPYAPLRGEGWPILRNPMATVTAGTGALVAGPNGLAMGRFGWADLVTGQVTNTLSDPTLCLGFVLRQGGTWGKIFYQGGAPMLRTGLPVTLAARGEFWARFPNGGTPGQQVYANPVDGTAIGGYALSAVPTPWVVITPAAPGELAIISPWDTFT